MSLPKKDRKIQSNSGKDFPADNDQTIVSSRAAPAITGALRREFGGSRSAIKTIARLTGANERAVKNWFEGRNGPNAEAVVSLMRHSDEVLECLLLLAGRGEIVTAKKLVDARQKLHEMIALIDKLHGGSSGG